MRPTASDASLCHYRLSRVEYDRAVEAGAFEPDAKLELIDGNLHAMTPEGTAHTTGMHLVADCLRQVFGSGFFVRIQNPLAVDEYSEPEPDVAVVTGTVRDYRIGCDGRRAARDHLTPSHFSQRRLSRSWTPADRKTPKRHS